MRNILFLGLILSLIAISGCSKDTATPNDRFNTYIKSWNDSEFAEMYDMLSEEARDNYDTEQFVDRYKKIYEDLNVENLKVTFEELSDEALKEAKNEGQALIPFSVTMDTIAGPIEFEYEANIIEEGEKDEKNWFIAWDPGFILPDLKEGGEIKIETENPRRGEILDRNKMPLAMNDTVYEVGVIPEKLEDKDATKKKLSQLLHMSTKAIDEALEADWVQPDLFVPLRNVPKSKDAILDELWSLSGVAGKEVTGRIYPAGESTAHLVGYVGQITGEELEEAEPGEYTATDMIGKRGLEQLFEDKLKGEKGVKILVTQEDAEEVVVAEKPVKDGENIELTIDINIQDKIYDSFKDDAGTATALDPKTGETIALVSAPAFDPNEMLYGMSEKKFDQLQNSSQKPLINRFSATFAPGSVMKPITAAIGLENGTIKPEEGLEIKGLTWSNGKGWGDYKVRRVSGTDKPVDLADAMKRSDNIYFAMQAVEMGTDAFVKGLKNFGFEEELPYTYPFVTSTISSDGKLDGEVPLANSSYGQAEIEMSALHLATSYATFINDGNMLKPTLLLEEETGQVWHENIVSAEDAALMKDLLRKVVTDGTAKAAKKDDLPISGKTGTAELKKSSKEKGHENGWFIGYPTKSEDIIIALMFENVENKGASAYAAEAVADILEDIK